MAAARQFRMPGCPMNPPLLRGCRIETVVFETSPERTMRPNVGPVLSGLVLCGPAEKAHPFRRLAAEVVFSDSESLLLRIGRRVPRPNRWVCRPDAVHGTGFSGDVCREGEGRRVVPGPAACRDRMRCLSRELGSPGRRRSACRTAGRRREGTHRCRRPCGKEGLYRERRIEGKGRCAKTGQPVPSCRVDGGCLRVRSPEDRIFGARAAWFSSFFASHRTGFASRRRPGQTRR